MNKSKIDENSFAGGEDPTTNLFRRCNNTLEMEKYS